MAVTEDSKAQGHYQMARIRLRQGRLREALQSARESVRIDPAYSPGYLILLRLLEPSEIEPLVDVIKRALQKQPKDLALKVALTEAQIAARLNTDALETARQILRRAETSVTAMKLLARAYLGKGNDAAAEVILNRASETKPDAEVDFLLAKVMHQRGEVLKTKKYLEAAIDKSPRFVEALNSLATLYLTTKSYDSAVPLLKKVTRYAPGFGPGWLNLGIGQRGLSRFKDAEKSWEEGSRSLLGCQRPGIIRALYLRPSLEVSRVTHV